MPENHESRPAGNGTASDVVDGDSGHSTLSARSRSTKRRTLTFVFESEHCVMVSGPGSRVLLTEIKGRPPIRSVHARAWAVSARTARDAVALADVRGFDVVVQHQPAPPPAVSPGELPDPGEGLW